MGMCLGIVNPVSVIGNGDASHSEFSIGFHHHDPRVSTFNCLPNPVVHTIYIYGEEINFTAKTSVAYHVVDIVAMDHCRQELRWKDPRIRVAAIKLSPRGNVLFIAVNKQTVPSEVNSQISAVAFYAVAGTDFDKNLVGCADHRKQEKNYPVFIGLRVDAESHVRKLRERCLLYKEIPILQEQGPLHGLTGDGTGKSLRLLLKRPSLC